MFTVHQMANNPKPLKVENHIVSNSENIDFKTGMTELEADIKINKTIQLLLLLFFCVWTDVFGKILFLWSALTILSTNV